MNKSFSTAPVRVWILLIVSMLCLTACGAGSEETANADNRSSAASEVDTSSQTQASDEALASQTQTSNEASASQTQASNEASATSPEDRESAGKETDRPYINKLLPEAQRIQSEYGVPIDLTLAIAIQETGWGKAEIGKNNHFGLRCASDDCVALSKGGQSIRYETCPDESECFDMFAESIKEMSPDDPGNIRKLYRNGYATSPKWAGKVRRIRRQVRKTLKAAGIESTN